MDAVCKHCKIPLKEEVGCSVCQKWKAKNLEWDEEPNSESPIRVMNQALRITDDLFARYERTMKEEDPKLLPSGATLNKILGILSKAPQIAESKRKLIKDEVTSVGKLGFRDQLQLLVAWVDTLPAHHRRQVVEEIESVIESKTAAAVPSVQKH